MPKALQLLSVLALTSAGLVFGLCVPRALRDDPQIEKFLASSAVERFRQAGDNNMHDGGHQNPPLVRQAEAFALYLNPPQPVKNVEAMAPVSGLKQAALATRPTEPTPKFTLIATSCYRSRPEQSMALICEPGGGTRWVKQGAHLGHFVVEKVERGMVVYRDGDQLCKMVLDMKAPVRAAQARQMTLASGQGSTSPTRPPSPHKPRTEPHKPLHTLGPTRPATRLVAYDRGKGGTE
jgi:hypothetical protein